MKKIVIFLFMLLSGAVSFPQAPESFSYQAVLRDNDGKVLSNHSVSLRVSLVQGSAEGSVVYTETFAVTTNDLGLVTLPIGQGTTSDDFSTIDWQAGPYFLRLAVDTEGGTAYTEMGTVQLLSVPYALHANTAANVFSGSYEDLSDKPDLSVFLTSETDPQVGDNVTDHYSRWNGNALVGGSLTESNSTLSTGLPFFAGGGITTPALTLEGTTRRHWPSGENGKIPFWATADSMGLTNLFFSKGKTGIGLASPAYAMDIAGSLQASDTLIAGKCLKGPAAVISDSILLGGTTSAVGRILYDDSTFVLSCADSSSTLLRIRERNHTRFSVAGNGTITASAFIDREDPSYLVDPNKTTHIFRLQTSSIQSSTIRAEIYYDLNNSQYYLRPSSRSSLYNLYVASTLQANTCTASWFMDSNDNNYYLSPAASSRMKNLYVEKIYDLNNSVFYLDPTNSSFVSDFTVNNELRSDHVLSKFYYDKDDNSYYLRPAGRSELQDMEIKGSMGIGGPPSDTYPLYVYGKAFSTGGWASSDIRYKKNISPLENELPKVMKLRGVHYQWRKDKFPNMGFDDAVEIGLVAQQVEKIFPELVREDDRGYKAVSYEKLTVVLLEAIKEQQKMIAQQQKSIEELRKEIGRLRK